jgi:hypothetical protein
MTMMTDLFAASVRGVQRIARTGAACAVAGAMVFGALPQVAHAKGIVFAMVPSAGAAKCLPHAVGRVTVSNAGGNDAMLVQVAGLPPNTGFDFF